MNGDRIAAVATQHADELRTALRAYSAPPIGERCPRSTPACPEPHADLRERLSAAAELADLPPQILLPAENSHHSPHRHG